MLAKLQRLEPLMNQLYDHHYRTDRSLERVLGLGDRLLKMLRRSISEDGGESDIE